MEPVLKAFYSAHINLKKVRNEPPKVHRTCGCAAIAGCRRVLLAKTDAEVDQLVLEVMAAYEAH